MVIAMSTEESSNLESSLDQASSASSDSLMSLPLLDLGMTVNQKEFIHFIASSEDEGSNSSEDDSPRLLNLNWWHTDTYILSYTTNPFDIVTTIWWARNQSHFSIKKKYLPLT